MPDIFQDVESERSRVRIPPDPRQSFTSFLVGFMLVWIDISNAPHAVFFSEVISFLQREGLECYVTARDYGYARDILDMKNVKYCCLGVHGGRNKRSKLLEAMERVKKLVKNVATEKVGALVSKASPEAVFVAFNLNLPVITAYDNELNSHQCKLTFPLSTELLTPTFFPREKIAAYGGGKCRLTRFRGMFEVAHVKYFLSRKSLNDFSHRFNKPLILVRPPPVEASYYEEENFDSFLVDLLGKISVSYDLSVLVFPRSKEQSFFFKNKLQGDIVVVEKAVDFLNLLSHASLMIGAGGTMTRESALMGTPTLFFGKKLCIGVTRELINRKLIFQPENMEDAFNFIKMVLDGEIKRKRAQDIVKLYEDPIPLLVEIIKNNLNH